MADQSIDASATAQFDELRQRVEDEFQSRFGSQPTVVAAAPARVNLIGEHIDYNDGCLLYTSPSPRDRG